MKFPKHNTNTQFRGFSTVSLSNIIAGIVGGTMWLLFATFMQVSDYGEIGFYISLAIVVGTASVFGMDYLLLTYFPKEKNERLVNQAISLTILSSAIGATIVGFFNWQAGVFVLGITYFSLTTIHLLSTFRYKEYAVTIVLERIIRLCLSLFLFSIIGPLGILLGFALSHLVLSVRFFQKTKYFSVNFDAIQPKFHFSMHGMGLNMVQLIPTLLDKSIIIALFGFTTVGLYQLGMQFISLATILPVSLLQYILPQRSAGNIPRFIIKFGILISLFFAILFVLLSPLVIDMWFKQFAEAKTLIQIIVVAIIPNTIIAIINAHLLSKERSKPVFIGGALYMGMLFGSLIGFGQIWGLIGLGIAFLFSQSVYAVFLLFVKKVLYKL